jgi:hypothetical protein
LLRAISVQRPILGGESPYYYTDLSQILLPLGDSTKD